MTAVPLGIAESGASAIDTPDFLWLFFNYHIPFRAIRHIDRHKQKEHISVGHSKKKLYICNKINRFAL